MLRLDTTTRKLQAVLASAIVTNQLPIIVSYSDKAAATYSGALQPTNTNSTTLVDICAAPSSGVVRDIDYLSARNSDTASATLTISLNDNGTSYILIKSQLNPGDTLYYTHASGWNVVDQDGSVKSITSSGYLALSGGSLSGNLGIGTNITRGRLDVSDGTVNLSGDNIREAVITGVARSPAGTNSSNLAVQSNDNMGANLGGSIAFGGRYLTAGAVSANWAYVYGFKEDAVSGNLSGYLGFSTRNAAGTTTEKMKIDSNGNVGMGTTPSAKLHLSGTFGTTQTSGLRIDGLGSTANYLSPIAFYNQSSNWGTAHAANIAAGLVDATNGGGYLKFSTAVDGNTAPVEQMRIDKSGNVGIGVTPGGSGKLEVAGNILSNQYIMRNNAGLYNGTTQGFHMFGFSDNNLYVDWLDTGAFVFRNKGTTEQFRIDANGNAIVTGTGGLGYGTGSGGTVTQLTSKATTVVINKTNGQIVMNSAALAAGATVVFAVTNTTVVATDVVVVSVNWAANTSYNAWVYYTTTNTIYIAVKNISAGPLSEAVVLNFAVIKAVTA